MHRNLTLNTFHLNEFFSYYDLVTPRKNYGVEVNNNVVVDTFKDAVNVQMMDGNTRL